MRISSSAELFQATSQHDNHSHSGLKIVFTSAPVPSPTPSDPSLNVPHSHILARFSYVMCSTLELGLDCCIKCTSLSHYGLIRISNVPHSRILARFQSKPADSNQITGIPRIQANCANSIEMLRIQKQSMNSNEIDRTQTSSAHRN
jgi:hypothetical protein